MAIQQLSVSVRNRTGKGPARRLRGRGMAPAVLYGLNWETVSLAVSPPDLIKALSGPLHTNTLLSLQIEGGAPKSQKEVTAMVRDHQYDPVSRDLLHVDFVVVDLEKKMQLTVPLQAIGRSIGVASGGLLELVFRDLPVECLPTDIPEFVTVDITELDINDSLSVNKIKLPDGVTVLLEAESTIAMVQAPKVEEEVVEEDEEGEGEEGEEGAKEGEEGAEGAKEGAKPGDPAAADKKPGDKKPGDKKPTDKKS